ncbi:MAG: hypothetical protein KJI69_01380 [Patescibacteria group bacterium]|nr:hypothetical protein [Patescibacteria group bacterium]
MRTIIVLFILLGMASPVFAQEFNQLEAPETIEDAKEFGRQIGEQLPDEMKKIFDTEAMPIWENMWALAGEIWEQYIIGWIDAIVANLVGLVGKEIEKRGPEIQAEFEKEKEELKKELQNEAKDASIGLWERFKSLLFD